MVASGRRWTVNDRCGNRIYLTYERWHHIVDSLNHPEMEDYEWYIQEALRRGRRRQEPLNPRKYRYWHAFDNLPDQVNHVVVIVLFAFGVDDHGQSRPNNYVATAFFKYVLPKR